MTEWFDLDDPSNGMEVESVGSIFKYLKGLDHKNKHRSCPMNHIHYPVDIKTVEGQSEAENSVYTKKPHQISCANKNNKLKPEPPNYWMKNSITCRDWKMKYCCENMWGTPGIRFLSRNGNIFRFDTFN